MKKVPAPCVLSRPPLGFGLAPVSAQTSTVGRHLTAVLTKRVLLMVAALVVSFSAASPVVAQEVAAAHWVGTWESSPQPIWGPDFIAPLKYPRNLWNQTVRQVSRVSIGGPRIRVVLSNEYGERPVTIGEAHIALAGTGPAIVAGSDRPPGLPRGLDHRLPTVDRGGSRAQHPYPWSDAHAV
jgi:hypothetical protein